MRTYHCQVKTLAFNMQAKGNIATDRVFAVETLSLAYQKHIGEKDKDYRKRIDDLFDEIEPKCGLLKFDNGQYHFWHLTLQEFLTSVYIVDNNTDYEKAISGYWDKDSYKEVVELFISYLSIQNRRWANQIVENIINAEDQKPFSKYLTASKAMIDIHRDMREDNVLNAVRKRLLTIIANKVEPKILVEAGDILGWLGDTRKLKRFVKIPGRKCELAKGPVDIKPFEIGESPVTNHWFEKFINADGYKKEEYWSKEGKKWLDETKTEYPRYWDDRKWKCPNSPVVGVTWYEVYAFTQWLTAMDKVYKYCLPNENEWEAVAAGTEGRKYPWGDKWDKNRCNNSEIEIGKTSSVGIFFDGKTPEGVFDLSGNVLEWTDSWLNEDKNYKVLRGGSWDLNSDYCQCASRYRYYSPNIRSFFVGFRCARTLTL
ncbi:MAG: formylglycine-generating enzyme family protein [Planctomycetes bacterium]|nr:formylglycine-generating enzyme family protein [Planctomycetota bacterium]